MRRALERVCMETRQLAFDVDRPIEHAYFPEGCVISITAVMADGREVARCNIVRGGFSRSTIVSVPTSSRRVRDRTVRNAR
jgi:hypothetical protein